jgi:membrane-associated protease RseP (regulator of RpoE activity)
MRANRALQDDLLLLHGAISQAMHIEESTRGEGFLETVGRFHPFLAQPVPALRERLSPFGYPYHLRRDGDRVILRLWEERRRKGRPSWLLNLLLFLLTLLSTLYAGSLQEGGDPFRRLSDLPRGIPFSFTLMAILGVHELGHYFASRRRHIRVTLPYFIPAPSILGTFGAFIKMKSPVPDKRTLLDIGVAGPLAGFAVALPALATGLLLSHVTPSNQAEGLILGSSLLLKLLSFLIVGPIPADHDLLLHPVAFAGWIGTLVTALNLLPLGQLDGGHVAYALLGRRQHGVARILFFALLILGFLWQGWLIWALLALVMGMRHPPPQDDWTPLDKKRKALALLAFLILVVCFIPVPFQFRQP